MKTIYLYCDGACRGNSRAFGGAGLASYGFVVSADEEQSMVITQGKDFLGEKLTNNIAEWESLYYGLKRCSDIKCDWIEVRMDSNNVISQISGQWKPSETDHLRRIHKRIANLIIDKRLRVKYKHIPREKNALADSLANRAVNDN